MVRAVRSVPLALLLLLSCSTSALAGGFTQRRGGYYLKVWNRSLLGNKAFDTNGDLVDTPESFQDHALNIYGEYGLTDEVTLSTQLVPLGFTKYGDESQLYAGTLAIGVRHALLRGPRPLALEVRAGGRPAIGDRELATGLLATGPYVVRSTLPTLFLDVELQAAASLPLGMWISAGAGARQHTRDGLSPALFGNLQLGLSTSFGLVLDLHAVAYFSVDRPDITDVLGVGQTDYLGVGLTVAYWITDHFGLTVGVDGAPLARANAGAAPIQFGVQLKD